MSSELDTKLNPSVAQNPQSPRGMNQSGIKKGFLYAFILTIGIGSF